MSRMPTNGRVPGEYSKRDNGGFSCHGCGMDIHDQLCDCPDVLKWRILELSEDVRFLLDELAALKGTK